MPGAPRRRPAPRQWFVARAERQIEGKVYVTQPTYTPPEPNAALVVGPSDHLVVSFPGPMEPDEFEAVVHALQDELRGRVTVVVGATRIAAVRPPERSWPWIYATVALLVFFGLLFTLVVMR